MSAEKYTKEDFDGYDSSFEDDEEKETRQKNKRQEYTNKSFSQPSATTSSSASIPSKTYFDDASRAAEGYRNSYLALNAYERHQKLINDYFLYFRGADADKIFKRDTSKDKRDIDVIRENHRFLWDDSDDPNTWGKQIAKKYYDKLYKEYTICDLSRYNENKLALRWRVEKELLDGKGQFICGAKKCDTKTDLKTWEVNFAYMEDSVKKNALVKLRLCPPCSEKLNFCQKRKEVIKKPKKRKKNRDNRKHKRLRTDETEDTSEAEAAAAAAAKEDDVSIWKAPLPEVAESKPIEAEFDEYLEDLFL